jgi:hypothetical protein
MATIPKEHLEIAHFERYCGLRVPPAFKSWLCLLASGASGLTTNSTTGDFLAQECTAPDYQRARLLHEVTAVDQVTSRLTCVDHGGIQGTPVLVVAEDYLPAPLPIGKGLVYYMANPTANSFQLSTLPGGTPITLQSTGSLPLFVALGGAWNSTTQAYEARARNLEFQAPTAAFSTQGFFVLRGSAKTKPLTATVNLPANKIVAASAHGLQNGDLVYVSGSTLPAPLTNRLYYCSVGSDTTGVTLFNTLSNALNFENEIVLTSAGAGLKLHAAGNVSLFELFPSAVTVAQGQAQPIELKLLSGQV